MTYHDYKVNKQAIRDLSEGKQTDAVKEFLKRYEIRPRENKKEQSVNQKEKTAMADKETQPQEPLQQSEVQQAAQQQQQPQAQQAAQESQGPRYRYNENMVNWEELEKVGISKASLEQQGLLDSMLKGYKTNKLVPLTIHLSGLLTAKLDARLSLIRNRTDRWDWPFTAYARNRSWSVLISGLTLTRRTRKTCVRPATWGVWQNSTCAAVNIPPV